MVHTYVLVHIAKHFLFFKVAKLEMKYTSEEVVPLPTVKLFLTGHIEAGKTALRQSLGKSKCKPRESLHQRTEETKDRTAGIEVENLEHDTFGSLVAYDLAGHCEYTTSHSVVIDCGSSSIFLILYDITGSLKKMRKEVSYWASFIKAGRHKNSQPYVLPVATHCDKALDNGKNMKDLQRIYSCIFEELHSHFSGVFSFVNEQFIVNCLNSTSFEINHLREVIGRCCHDIRMVRIYNTAIVHYFEPIKMPEKGNSLF